MALCSNVSKGSVLKIKIKVLEMTSRALHELSSFPTALSLARSAPVTLACLLCLEHVRHVLPWMLCNGCSLSLNLSSPSYLHDHPLVSFKSLLKWLPWQNYLNCFPSPPYKANLANPDLPLTLYHTDHLLTCYVIYLLPSCFFSVFLCQIVNSESRKNFYLFAFWPILGS